MALFQDEPMEAGGETFIQRQRRLQGTATAQTAAPAPTSPTAPAPAPTAPTTTQTSTAAPAPAPAVPGTPVSGDGKIPAPAPTPAPAPAPAPAPQQPITVDPFAAVGGGVQIPGGGWIPKGMATPAQLGAAAPAAPTAPTYANLSYVGGPTNTGPQAAGTPLQGMNLGNNPFATYQASEHNVAIPQLGQLPAAYGGSQFGQFATPDQQQTQGMQNSLMQAILGEGGTMNPQVLAALKEKQKEAALLMQTQGMQGAAQSAAARGMTNGGAFAGQQRALEGDTMNRVLTGNRDLDIAAAEQNRQDQLNALSASNQMLSGQMDRATQGFGAQLAGQTAQAGDTRAASQDAIQRAIQGFDANMQSSGMDLQQQAMNAEERYKQFATVRAAQDAELQRVLQQFGVNQGVVDSGRADASLALQGELGRGGLAIDQQRLAQQGSQFDKGYDLDILRFLEGQRQSDNSLGFNYTQLGANQQNALTNAILGIGR